MHTHKSFYYMKNILIATLLISTLSISAQKIYHSKLTFGAGLFTLQEVDKVVSTISVEKENILNFNLNQSQYSPVYFVEFGSYILNGIVNLSANASYSKFTEDYVYTLNTIGESTTIDNNYYSLMFGTNIYYLGPIHLVELYSGGYIGAYVSKSSSDLEGIQIDQNSELAYHINALGVRVGKSIGAHVEVGYGFLGIVNFGLSAQF